MSDYIKSEVAAELITTEIVFELSIRKGISYKETIESFPEEVKKIKKSIQECLKQAPSVDVVEVIRCKDCKYYLPRQGKKQGQFSRSYCNKGAIKATKDNDYCSYGEPKEQDNEHIDKRGEDAEKLP